MKLRPPGAREPTTLDGEEGEEDEEEEEEKKVESTKLPVYS